MAYKKLRTSILQVNHAVKDGYDCIVIQKDNSAKSEVVSKSEVDLVQVLNRLSPTIGGDDMKTLIRGIESYAKHQYDTGQKDLIRDHARDLAQDMGEEL
jgi:hypothetical protein